MKVISLLILFISLAGTSLAQPCDGINSSLIVSTGYNPVAGSLLGNYDFDPMWKLIQAPADPVGWTSNIGGPAIVVPLTSPWSYAGPQSRYINAYPTAQALTDNWGLSTTPYIYERQFCVCIDNGSPTVNVDFDLSLNADNWAELYLEDDMGNQTLLVSQPYQYVTSNFMTTPTTANVSLQLAAGNYKLKLYHRNKLVIMGANLDATIYSSGTLSDNACRKRGMIAGFVNEDTNENLVFDNGDQAVHSWNMNLYNSSNTLIQTITSDHSGLYFFMDLEPGTYTVSTQPPSGWSVITPSTSSYSVTVDTNVVHVKNFLVTPEGTSEETNPTECQLNVANVITPDGDGINDELFFTKDCDAPFKATIVDRWGLVVFESTDPSQSWNGTDLKGKKVAVGVYFYTASINHPDKPIEEAHGFIQVVK